MTKSNKTKDNTINFIRIRLTSHQFNQVHSAHTTCKILLSSSDVSVDHLSEEYLWHAISGFKGMEKKYYRIFWTKDHSWPWSINSKVSDSLKFEIMKSLTIQMTKIIAKHLQNSKWHRYQNSMKSKRVWYRSLNQSKVESQTKLN